MHWDSHFLWLYLFVYCFSCLLCSHNIGPRHWHQRNVWFSRTHLWNIIRVTSMIYAHIIQSNDKTDLSICFWVKMLVRIVCGYSLYGYVVNTNLISWSNLSSFCRADVL